MDYLLLAGLMREKNTVPGWKFTIVYEQANRLVVRIDVLEVGLCPYTLAQGTHLQCVRHPIGVTATATKCLKYPYVLGRNIVHRFASTGRVTERERGGGTVCAIGFRGNASII